MNKTVVALFALLALPLLLVAQPAVTWLEESHDFGIIREADGKVEWRFRFVNTGDSALVVANVRTSCGCTASEYTHSAIAAGDTSEIIVTYNPARRPGSFEKEIFVTTNAKPHRSLLTISGLVLADEATLLDRYPVTIGALRLESASMPLGEIIRGKVRHSHINALNNTLDTIGVTITGAPQHIDATVTPERLAPGEGSIVSIKYRSADAPLWGLNIDTIGVKVESNSGKYGVGELMTMAIIAEDFSKLAEQQRARAPHVSVDTNLLNTFERHADGTYRATFAVKNTGRDRLEIRRLWCPERAVTFKPRSTSIKGGKATTVEVIVAPALLDTPLLNTNISIITNDPDRPTVNLRAAMQAKQ